MQPAPYVVHSDAKAGERVRLKIDVPKIDRAGPGRTNKSAVLPIDASITDWAFRIVPNRELTAHRAPSETGYFRGSSAFCFLFRSAASALSFRNGRERGQTSPRNPTSVPV